MRLMIILALGAMLIAGTYFYTNSSRGESSPQQTQTVAQASQKVNAPVHPSPAASLPVAQGPSPAAGLKPQDNSHLPAPSSPPPENSATSLDQARIRAKAALAKSDPFAPLSDVKPFPGAFPAPPEADKADNSKHLPPPPKATMGSRASTVGAAGKSELVPPPPAFGDVGPGHLPSGLAFGDLPGPPENQSLASKLALVGIVGDHAIFNITDFSLRRSNGWPKTFSLAEGRSFQNVRLLSIGEDSAILEEDGERILKNLPAVK